MGLGKTFTGSEKLILLGGQLNLVICQKSKIDDWVNHFRSYYSIGVFDLTKKKQYDEFFGTVGRFVGVINYDVVFKRSELSRIKFDTVMLDESSLIQNESSKRSKFILERLNFENIILLSGTPTNGKYENLWSQLRLLGWNISKDLYWQHYINFEWQDNNGFPLKVVTGYKNVDRLKCKLREYGAQFLKTEDVINLPDRIEQTIFIPTIKEYRKFKKDAIVSIHDTILVGDTILTKLLYERQLCGHYNNNKIEAFQDLVESTSDRLIVFYNFNAELELLKQIADKLARPTSEVNGHVKDLSAWEQFDNAILLAQYQSAAYGLNLQQGNKIIYFTLPFGKGSCGTWEQSKKRIHRIGQNQPCFYYYLLCKGSIEEKNLELLKLGKELTDELFIEEVEHDV